ncbi:hypothetical protein DSO57_1014597 [Entomophthora muscae]|uniref:Uncharacterized protein n=1 Tax=Entomophthora muscae TaxID=34485 RepID=A0ACC2UFG3_9FUNG|nr:hypothetical protein DSO57_1014597 [Entomophthora muscae]
MVLGPGPVLFSGDTSWMTTKAVFKPIKQMVGVFLPPLWELDPIKAQEDSLQGLRVKGSNPALGPGFQGEKIVNPDRYSTPSQVHE